MSPRGERLALAAVLVVAAVLRLAAPGADVPLRVETTDAPVQDAFWYLEAAAGPAEGLPRDLEPHVRYDPPVWVHAARSWFGLAGVSLGTAQALGALVSLLTLLVAWRWLRAAFGPVAALAAAAVLAVADPFAGLSRTTLVYGPATLALTCAAALGWAAGRPPPRDRAPLEAAAWLALALATFAVLERTWPARDLVQPAVMVRAAAAACLAAALERWLVLRQRRPALAYRLALGGAAWAVLAGCLVVLTPPVAALAGGLGLAHLVRAGRPGRALLALGAVALLGGALLLADPGHADRLARYVNPDVWAPEELLLRVLRLGGELRPHGRGSSSGTGLVALAPGVWLAAGLGLVGAARRWHDLTPGRREALALATGWVGLWLLGALLVDYRPLRYAVVVASPLAALAAVAVAALLEPTPGPLRRARASGRPDRTAGGPLPATPPSLRADLAAVAPGDRPASPSLRAHLTAVLLGALAAPHAVELVAGPRRLGDLAVAALGGAAIVLAALGARLHLRPSATLRRHLGALLLAAAVLPGLLRGALDLRRPAWSTAEARDTAGRVLGPRASLIGPHASVLALGHGLTRRRGPWVNVAPEHTARTIRELRRLGITHIAVGLEQERTSGLRSALARHGVEASLVGIFLPRGVPVLVLRLPWWRECGYEPSAFERRQGAAPPEPEPDRAMLLTRVRTLAFQGDAEGALAIARISLGPQHTRDPQLTATIQAALLNRGLR